MWKFCIPTCYQRGRGDYLPDCIRFSSICFTINRLVSRNLSTQFAKQVSSLREKRVDGVPVTHLSQHWTVKLCIWELILAFEMEVNGQEENGKPSGAGVVRTCACCLSRNSANSFWTTIRQMLLVTKWAIPELFRRTCPPFYVVPT